MELNIETEHYGKCPFRKRRIVKKKGIINVTYEIIEDFINCEGHNCMSFCYTNIFK